MTASSASPRIPAHAPSPILQVSGLSKSFPGQRALVDVSLEVRSGEVHALVGQNGAGKSTLIKLLAGFHTPDPGGEILLNGRPFDAKHQHSEIGFVHQDLALVPTLNAAENIAMVRGFETGRFGGIRWRSEHERAHQLIVPFGVDLDVTIPVARLTAVQRTVVAMARAASDSMENTELLILDEPTAALPGPEVERLLRAIRRFKAAGGGVLYVSHRLDEVFMIADRVTVLRNGHALITEHVHEVDHRGLVTQMLGRPLEEVVPTRAKSKDASPQLEVRDLEAVRLQRISFTVRTGEVLGIAGIVGSGREDIAPLLFGASMPLGGAVLVAGKQLASGSPRSSLENGVAYVPTERTLRGLVMAQCVRENLLLPRIGRFTRLLRLDRRAEGAETDAWMDRVGVVPRDSERIVSLLSGGNQQKVVFAKALGIAPRVLLLDEPGQGIDVAAKQRIFQLIAEAAAAGMSVVLCTAEIEDLPRVCDRVLVLRHGEVATELSSAEITQHRLLEATTETIERNLHIAVS